MLEVEIKTRVPDLAAVRERLLIGHAGIPDRVHERDIYYNAPHRDFGETDEALRLRYAGGGCTLTYKGKKRKEYRLKAREELNCSVDGGMMDLILQRLGFLRVAEVEKWREYYLYHGATVSLDEVKGLGSFVEIEATESTVQGNPEEFLRELAKELGLEGEPILSSYLELLLSRA